jgi:glycosyltransferase involved in cell wall biosynthesis
MYEFLRTVKLFISQKKTINGFDKFCTSKPNKRALLSYLVHPFLPPMQFWEKVLFSNRGMAIQMVRALNELGYVIDIVDFENMSWKPKHNYDLFIGHGGRNFKHLIENNLSSKKKIYFSTGPYWKFLNINEAKRFYEFTLKTGYILPPDRYVRFEEEYANREADGIICLGNKNILKTYPKFNNVININNGHFLTIKKKIEEKDFDSGRKHFLFFSGRGNIHKGLDLLIDVFKNTDLHLHICQWIEPAFESIYRESMYNEKNIHVEGFVKMRSEKFNKLVDKCNWVILPTCAEGQPGSVIECMAYGLIPILPEFANIDLGDYGIQIDHLDTATISNVIANVSKMDVNECLNRAIKTRDITAEKYSVENFKDNFKEAIQRIIKD